MESSGYQGKSFTITLLEDKLPMYMKLKYRNTEKATGGIVEPEDSTQVVNLEQLAANVTAISEKSEKSSKVSPSNCKACLGIDAHQPDNGSCEISTPVSEVQSSIETPLPRSLSKEDLGFWSYMHLLVNIIDDMSYQPDVLLVDYKQVNHKTGCQTCEASLRLIKPATVGKHADNISSEKQAHSKASPINEPVETGLPVHSPEFMLRLKADKENQKLINIPFLDSSDGSDPEWTLALEREGVKNLKSPQKMCSKSSTNKKQKMTPKPKQKKQKTKEIETTTEEEMETSSEEEEIHVYPLRKKRMTNYMSLVIPEDDDFLYCEECNLEYDGDCPVHGALFCVEDVEVSQSNLTDRSEYNKKTLPDGLVIKKSKTPNAGLGVFAVKNFPVRTRFGPYRGKKESNEEKANDSGYSWQIMTDEKNYHFVDAKDPGDSNWMRFVNRARHDEEHCLTAYQYKSEIYYRSHKPILAGTEILVYCGDSYARGLGIKKHKFCNISRKKHRMVNVDMPETNINSEGAHTCSQCYLSFSDFRYLQQHMKMKHNDQYWKLRQNKVQEEKLSKNKTVLESNMKHDLENRNTRYESFKDNESKLYVSYIFDAELNVKQKLQTNTIVHSGETPYKCDVGGVEITQKCNLKSQKRIHSREKPYKCDVCDVKFNHSGHLKSHKRIHTGEKPYKCDVCGLDFTESGHLKSHKRIHTGERPYKCDVCGVKFNQSGQLKSHKRIHTGEKPYKCDVCGVDFKRSDTLKSHKKMHTGEKPYKCDVCDVKFNHSGHLKSHKRIHTGEKPYKCDVCGLDFTESGNLKSHKRIHTGERPYKCDVCGVKFNQSGQLKSHKRIHTGEKPYKCDVCGVDFKRSDTLKSHKKMHTGEKPYKCDVCDVKFNHSGHLKSHKRIHTGEKPYKCDVCGLDFTESGNLKSHKRIHTGERPYKCDVCGVKFNQSGQLKSHKRIHTGEKPYKCDVCGVDFKRSDSLKSHKKMHTGEKPYKCDVCGGVFNQIGSLKLHKRIHNR